MAKVGDEHEQVILDYDKVEHLLTDSSSHLLPGMVVVTSGDRKSVISKLVAWATGSWWTHVFIVTDLNKAVEAYNPKVREIVLAERMTELQAKGQYYIVLDLPGITDQDREKVAAVARSFIGRPYNNLQTILFGFSRVFWNFKAREPFCSTLVTKVFQSAIGRHIFTDHSGNELIARFYYRWHNLMEGLATPAEIVQFSALQIVGTDVVL